MHDQQLIWDLFENYLDAAWKDGKFTHVAIRSPSPRPRSLLVSFEVHDPGPIHGHTTLPLGGFQVLEVDRIRGDITDDSWRRWPAS